MIARMIISHMMLRKSSLFALGKLDTLPSMGATSRKILFFFIIFKYLEAISQEIIISSTTTSFLMVEIISLPIFSLMYGVRKILVAGYPWLYQLSEQRALRHQPFISVIWALIYINTGLIFASQQLFTNILYSLVLNR